MEKGQERWCMFSEFNFSCVIKLINFDGQQLTFKDDGGASFGKVDEEKIQTVWLGLMDFFLFE